MRFTVVVDVTTPERIDASVIGDEIERRVLALARERGWSAKVWPASERENGE